jgi:hypothetical protein
LVVARSFEHQLPSLPSIEEIKAIGVVGLEELLNQGIVVGIHTGEDVMLGMVRKITVILNKET